MVKHTKNDSAISDLIDKEIKTILRNKLGTELVETIDPMLSFAKIASAKHNQSKQ
jgi:hypothetical protein